MKHHERTRIIIEMEFSDGELNPLLIEVKCWDKKNAVKISREEALFILSSNLKKALEYTKGGESFDCENCKHYCWYPDEDVMPICEQLSIPNPRAVCKYFEKKGESNEMPN